MRTAKLYSFFKNPAVPVYLWFAAAVLIPVALFFQDGYNNYRIFQGVFYHSLQHKNLYLEYPGEHFDSNHYGPFFSVLIAPFAPMPLLPGMILWSVFNTWLLYKAIQLLPLTVQQKTAMYWICFVELTTTQHGLQTNAAIAAWVLLAFIYIGKRRESQAALAILLGFFVKIYGIVALAFGLFSARKARLALFLAIWAVVLFVLPMVFSSPQFVIQSYKDWAESLTTKNLQNTGVIQNGYMQNISIMGMISRIFGIAQLPLLYVLAPGALLMAAPLLRFKQYRFQTFQMHYVAAILLSIVLFSTGSESPTFIIAVTGAALYFVLQPRPYSGWVVFLLWFMLLITSLSPTDLFPAFIRKQYIQPYSLKALPCFLIWLTIIFELITKPSFNFGKEQ